MSADPNREELSGLPYMDAVLREVLRLNCPVPSTIRLAKEDAMLPLGQPVRGKNGQMIESVKLRKGTTLFIRESGRLSMLLVHRSCTIFSSYTY
jgi:hypothetical protein